MGSGYGYGGTYGTGPYKGEGGAVTGLSYDYPANKLNSSTGVCLRYGINKEQGSGWSKYENGDNWLWPEPFINPIMLVDDNGHQRFIINDEITGRVYEHPTRNGPTGSGLVANYLDKEGPYGGAEIPCAGQLKEHRGAKESNLIQHIVSWLHLRPQQESNRNTTGHTATGYRNLFQVTFSLFKDGIQSYFSRTKNIPDPADISVDRKTEGHRIQPRFDTTTSEFKIVNSTTEYLVKDAAMPRSNRTMTESGYQLEYATPVLWITRGKNPILNRAIPVDCTGSYFAVGTGPDNKNSSLQLSPTDSLITPIVDLTGDFTLQLAVTGISFPTRIIQFSTGGLQIVLSQVLTSTYLDFIDGVNTFSQLLSYNGTGWLYLKITRSGMNFIVSENGVIVNTIAVTALNTYGGNITIKNIGICEVFDIRGYNTVISEDAFEYYYNDITQNQGKALLPPW